MPAPDPLRLLSVLRAGPDTTLQRVQHAVSEKRFLSKSAPAGDERLRAKLKSEYDFLTAVGGPHFLTALEWDAAASRLTLSDAQCTLAQLLGQHGRLDPTLVARVLYQCLQALDRLRAANFAHGHLTTDGVFVTPDGDVALGDFVGYRFDLKWPPVRPEYQVRYRAPELIDTDLEDTVPDRGRGPSLPPAVRADLYSLGYMAIQMLRSESEFLRMFGLSDTQAKSDQVNWDGWHGNLELPPPKLDEVLYDVPVGLRDVIEPLIQKPPQARAGLRVHAIMADIVRLGLMSDKKLPAFGAKVTREHVPVPPTKPTKVRTPSAPQPPARDRRVLVLTDSAGRSVMFSPGRPVVVGSSSSCDLTVGDTTVDRRHTILIPNRATGWRAYDLRTSGGTNIDGASAESGLPVRTHSKLRVGSTELSAAVLRGYYFAKQFLVAERLHSGQNGKFLRAFWMQPEKGFSTVALRVFPQGFSANEDGIRRFIRSIPDAGKFRHANIVSLYRGGFVNCPKRGRQWYLVMRYMGGGSLREACRDQPLPARRVVGMAIDVATAVRQIHARGLVHRNISPSCILFAADGRAALSDFLFCRPEELATYQQVTRSGDSLMLDFAYQSPELLRGGDAPLSCQTDLYSLAASMYHAATGRPPFETSSRSLPQILTAVLTQPVPTPRDVCPDVPVELSDLIQRGLAKDPSQRFASPDALLAELTRLDTRSWQH
jgi:serine/threonine protein kinase